MEKNRDMEEKDQDIEEKDQDIEEESPDAEEQETDQTEESAENGKKPRKRRVGRTIAISFGVLFVVLLAAVGVFLLTYYHADEEALRSLNSTKFVTITEKKNGYLFDGPGEDRMFIFYPGARVEETAYAPMLKTLALFGLDVYLVKMPFHLAVLDGDAAEDVIKEYDYKEWIIGGHSMGGVMAARYASEHPDQIKAVILLASYSVDKLNDPMMVLSIYGDQDGVLNMADYEEAKQNYPSNFYELKIAGGNHALFGYYGKQRKDGTATITAEDQQEMTVDFIMEQLKKLGSD